MKTVKKTLDILEVFLDSGNEVGISDLAEITGQNVSTIHGIIKELAEKGYIRQRKSRGKYSLGAKFLSFGETVNKMMAIEEELFHPYMVKLSKELNETVNIAIKNGNYAVNIGIVHSDRTVQVVIHEKIGAPLYCTGVGKALLAGMTNEELDKYFKSEKLISYTKNTVTDIGNLKKQIHKIRKTGLAYDFEEYREGVANIVAPVKDHSGKIVAAIGILVPSATVNANTIKVIGPVIKKCAADISSTLGYRKHKPAKSPAIAIS